MKNTGKWALAASILGAIVAGGAAIGGSLLESKEIDGKEIDGGKEEPEEVDIVYPDTYTEPVEETPTEETGE